MPYGIIKVDTITFTDASSDKSINISGLVKNPTFSGNVTATGTISGTSIQGGTLVSGATITGSAGQFTSITGGTAGFTTVTGTTVFITSGVFASGTASAPSLAFTGNLNTGIYSPATNQVAISTSGTGRVFVAADGTVGVGISAPLVDLHVNNAAGARIRAGGGTSAGFEFNSSSTRFDIPATNTIAAYTSDLERFRIDSSGRLLLGSSSTVSVPAWPGDFTLQYNTSLQNNGATVGTSAITSIAWNNTVNGAGTLSLAKSRSTTIGTYALGLASGDYIGNIVFSGDDSQKFVAGALISAAADGTPGLNSMPGRLIFSTTPSGSASPVERLRISSAGTTTLTSAASTAPFIANISASEVARIDSSGRLLLGTSTSIDTRNYLNSNLGGTVLQVHGTSQGYSALGAYSWSSTLTAPSALVLSKSISGTVGTRGALTAANTDVGSIVFNGDDGTNFVPSACINCVTDGTPASTQMPGRIVLSTNPGTAAAAPVEKWRLTSAGVVVYDQPTPAAVDATATLTVANLTAKIITSTTAAAVTMTLPLGTSMDTGFSGTYVNMSFEWSVINTGATNAVTVQANTGHTIVGSATVAASNSGRFLSRRTAANTWVTYRLSS